MGFCWEADLRGRQGRRVSRAKPQGRAEEVGFWRAEAKGGRGPRLRGVGGGSPRHRGGPVGGGGMPRAKRALAMLGEGAGGGGAS